MPLLIAAVLAPLVFMIVAAYAVLKVAVFVLRFVCLPPALRSGAKPEPASRS